MAHTDFLTAVAQPIDLRAAVREYRENEAALRRLKKSSGAWSTARNHGANEAAVTRRIARREVIELSLVLAGHIELIGRLTEERHLLQRLAWAAELSHPRPELKRRLAAERRIIRLLLPA